jgi:hypothetical protein
VISPVGAGSGMLSITISLGLCDNNMNLADFRKMNR